MSALVEERIMDGISGNLWSRACAEAASYQASALGSAPEHDAINQALLRIIEGVRTVLTFESQVVPMPDLLNTVNLPPPILKKLDELMMDLEALLAQFQAVVIVTQALGELERAGVSPHTAQEIVAVLRRAP